MGILKHQVCVAEGGAHEGVAGVAKLIHRVYHGKDDIQAAVLAQGQEHKYFLIAPVVQAYKGHSGQVVAGEGHVIVQGADIQIRLAVFVSGVHDNPLVVGHIEGSAKGVNGLAAGAGGLAEGNAGHVQRGVVGADLTQGLLGIVAGRIYHIEARSVGLEIAVGAVELTLRHAAGGEGGGRVCQLGGSQGVHVDVHPLGGAVLQGDLAADPDFGIQAVQGLYGDFHGGGGGGAVAALVHRGCGDGGCAGGHAGDNAVFVHGGYGLVTAAPDHAAGEGYGLDFHGELQPIRGVNGRRFGLHLHRHLGGPVILVQAHGSAVSLAQLLGIGIGGVDQIELAILSGLACGQNQQFCLLVIDHGGEGGTVYLGHRAQIQAGIAHQGHAGCIVIAAVDGEHQAVVELAALGKYIVVVCWIFAVNRVIVVGSGFHIGNGRCRLVQVFGQVDVFQGPCLRSDHFQNRAVVAQAHDEAEHVTKAAHAGLGRGGRVGPEPVGLYRSQVGLLQGVSVHGVDTGAVVIVQGIAHGGAAQDGSAGAEGGSGTQVAGGEFRPLASGLAAHQGGEVNVFCLCHCYRTYRLQMGLGVGHGPNGGATLGQGSDHTVFHLSHGFIAAEPGDGLVLQAPGHDLSGQFRGAAREELHFGAAQGDAHCLVGGAQRLLGRDDIQAVEPGVGNGTADGGVRRLRFAGIGGIHLGRLAGGGVQGPQIAAGLVIRGVVTAGPVENVRIMIPCHGTGHAGAVAVNRISVGAGVAGLRVVHRSQVHDSAVHSIGGLPGVQEAGAIAVGVVHSIEVTLVVNGQGYQIAPGTQTAGDIGVGEGQLVGQGQLAGDQVYGVQVVTAA